MIDPTDLEIEMSKLYRECYARAVIKLAAGQFGEAFVGLDDRRHTNEMRGPDRRAECT